MARMWECKGMYQRIGFTIVLGVVAFGSGGCFGLVASEDWVRNEIRQANAPIQTKVTQLEVNAAQAKTALDQVNARVTQLDGRVSQVSTQVTQARAAADGAVQKAGVVEERLTRALANRYKRELVSTVSLLFDPGKSALEAVHGEALGGVLKVLADNPT